MKKKKAKRLVLSDDESDLEENDNKNDNENDNDSENDNENDEEKEVMYDSEENEVQVPVFKGFVGKKGYVNIFLKEKLSKAISHQFIFFFYLTEFEKSLLITKPNFPVRKLVPTTRTKEDSTECFKKKVILINLTMIKSVTKLDVFIIDKSWTRINVK